MANINVEDLNIEHGDNQIVGDPFEVEVHVNNRELMAPPPWKDTRCSYETPAGGEAYGHGATVEVQVLRSGTVVRSESTHVCAPIDSSGHPDPRPSWTFDLRETGDYDIRATVDPDVHGPTSSESRTITVQETGNQQRARDGDQNNGGDSWNPFPNDDDGDNNPLTPDLSTQQKAALAGVGLLLVLAVARPYASLGSEVVG